jgi:hypothetical protein
MLDMKKITILCFLAFIGFGAQVRAQNLALDVSVSTSLQDKFANNLALRYQVSPRFRMGVEVQTAIPKYRFIDAKPIREGYAFKFLLPTTTRLYQKEKLRLDLIGTVGFRRQGVLDPDNNDTRDSILNGPAAIINTGLAVSSAITDRFALQGGILVPVIFQIQPSSLFEAIHGPMINAGFSYKTTEKTAFFMNSQIGGATGAGGDTYKYSWSLLAGVRFGFNEFDHVVEPTFSF